MMKRKGKQMSASYDSYDAYVIFGVKVNNEVLHQFDEQRGCSHEETDKAYCAICGAPMFETVKRDIEIEIEPFDNGKLSYYYSYYEDEEIVIGFQVMNTDNISELVVLTDEQKEDYTNQIVNWFIDNNIELKSEPKTHLMLCG